ncbi:MAG TPA: sugar phosphate nucleotidyltransferase, partial [Rhodanobacteraceae bacterium]|nr:sugar phosphate nucleotidyltransferase [Rhodanobacteraceae bacterium]
NAARLEAIGSSTPKGATAGGTTVEKPFVASMGIYVFSRDVLLEILQEPGVDFGKEIIPRALSRHLVIPYIHRGYWADVGTIASFYDANIQLTKPGAPFNFFHPRWPIYTHPRFLPATRAFDCRLESSIVAEGCYLEQCEIADSVVGIRTHIGAGAKVTRSVLLGADFYEEETSLTDVALGIGRDAVLDRVIVDKNARIGDGVRLVNAQGIDHADGDGYYIRNGIIIVPKGAKIGAGATI